MEASLGPSKDPGNGAQGVNAGGCLALGRAAADVHAPQLTHRCALAEEVNEARVLPHHVAVGVTRHLDQGRQASEQ